MAETTHIEWADSTFNPWIGCTKISPGCDHCYAERDMDVRLGRAKWGAGQPRSRTSESYWRQPLRWNRADFRQCGDCRWRGEVDTLESDQCPRCDRHENLEPARRRVFCASLSDVFDNEVDPQWRIDLLELIAATPNLDWILLTKRIGNVERMLDEALDVMSHGLTRWRDAPWPNVWLCATITNQAEADRDVIKLLRVPAHVHGLSMEPLLGAVDLTSLRRFPEGVANCEYLDALRGSCWTDQTGLPNPDPAWAKPGVLWDRPRIDWVIVGGESGPAARPMHPDWARSLRDQCAAAAVPFLFKQWGEWCPRGPESLGYPSVDGAPRFRMTDAGHNGQDLGADGGNDVWMNRAGKKATGRLLDGAVHNGFPGT